MPVPGETTPGSVPALSEFSAFKFPPPPTRPGHVVLNRFVLYETKTRFFIVGTNAPAGTRFRVLKIDRTTAPSELGITEDEHVYSKAEVDDLLEMIATGNRSTGGMREVTKFYGIVGFVRFTEGYYITLITKRSPVALIGGHYIFHIDATSSISIHSSTTPTSKLDKNSDEARYLQMFQMVDLTKNFYFSYSYDITRTLQWNMTRNPQVEGRNRMFVWNQYLLENAFGAQTGIENQWALPIMYGFVDQSKLSILGRNVYVTLIARRSRFFAGARFLKRGANDRGYVANDVETEQIVSEMSTTSFYGAGSLNANPNHTSFVQHRGSIPLYWVQDGTNMSPKPPIELNVVDPYFSAAALHFDDMFKRYGAPCIVLNLIKAKEKTPRESLLLKEFSECIEYLNQFLPEDKKIWHIKWDMSRASKSPNENVISVLEIIAERAFAQTGFFHSGYNQDSARQHHKNVIYGSGLQNGVVRTNCIDCLDRTNAAQFIIAKCALGHQLYSLGLIAEPVVPFDCDLVNMLTEMYHDHGDTIALQYGGSHLVNTMETYRKINQWTSQSRDMIESIRRFYSNSFVDAEKQDAMNLFLGNYRVQKGTGPALWELPGDYHLHNITDPELKKNRKSYTRWWSADALLPQEVLANKSFLEAREKDYNRFHLHDAGYDDDSGLIYGDDDDSLDDEDDYDVDSRHASGSNGAEAGLERDDSNDRLDKYDPNLKQYSAKHNDHIENLRSEDEDEFASNGYRTREFGKNGRVHIMQPVLSEQSGTSLSDGDQGIRRSSPASSKHSSVNSISTMQLDPAGTTREQGHHHVHPVDSGAQYANTGSSTTPTLENQLPGSSESGMMDIKERIVAPPVLLLRDGDAMKPNAMPMSSSSSLSSMQRYYPRYHLRHSESRSSMATSNRSGPGSIHFSRGEKFVHDGFDACDGDANEDSAVGGWDEYWDEYYRPKVQTSFQRLFAYNMNSTSRYLPPNVKNTSEQSPFEVRQNHMLSQAEMNAKAAAKSEKRSMLSWLGLAGGSDSTGANDKNANNNNKNRTPSSKASSNYSNGSKTLPLSTGRKKGFLSSLDESEEKGGDTRPGHKDGVAHHARSTRLSIASFPVTNGDYDEKMSLSGSTRTLGHQHGQDGKVRLPAHIPRTKEEEWELTKNVWTNLPQFAIHDPNFVPGSTDGKTSESTTDDKASGGAEGNKDGQSAGVIEGGTTKGRSHIEEMVKRSLQPDVTSHEYKEYKRYTQQFKSIRFDSVPTKGAASYGINAQTSQKEEWPAGTAPNTASPTPLSGSVANGLSQMQHPPAHGQQRNKGSATHKAGMSTSSSLSTARPGWIGAQRQAYGGSSGSILTIGATDLNEEEEFYYAASRGIGPGSQPNGHEAERMRIMTSGSNDHSGFKASPMSPNSPANGHHWRDNLMPEPPILLAPLPTTVKAPSESEMVLYTAHVELPKLTLYTVGQTCLNPYWGTNSGTRARYDAYMMWILKGRYGYMPNAATGAGAGLLPSAQAQAQALMSGRPVRKGSSNVDQPGGVETALNGNGGGKEKQLPPLQQQQQQQTTDVHKDKNKDRTDDPKLLELPHLTHAHHTRHLVISKQWLLLAAISSNITNLDSLTVGRFDEDLPYEKSLLDQAPSAVTVPATIFESDNKNPSNNNIFDTIDSDDLSECGDLIEGEDLSNNEDLPDSAIDLLEQRRTIRSQLCWQLVFNNPQLHSIDFQDTTSATSLKPFKSTPADPETESYLVGALSSLTQVRRFTLGPDRFLLPRLGVLFPRIISFNCRLGRYTELDQSVINACATIRTLTIDNTLKASHLRSILKEFTGLQAFYFDGGVEATDTPDDIVHNTSLQILKTTLFEYFIWTRIQLDGLKTLELPGALYRQVRQALNRLPALQILELSKYDSLGLSTGEEDPNIPTQGWPVRVFKCRRSREGATLANLVRSMPHLTHLDLGGVTVGLVAELSRSCRNLIGVRFDIKEECYEAMNQLFVGCPGLTHCSGEGHAVLATDLIREPHWTCLGLQYLDCAIRGVSRLSPSQEHVLDRMRHESRTEPATDEERKAFERRTHSLSVQRQIYQRLACFTDLRHLALEFTNIAIGSPHKRFASQFDDGVYFRDLGSKVGFIPDTLELSLESGLSELATLSRLRSIKFRSLDYRIGMRDLNWMVDTWPLERIVGLQGVYFLRSDPQPDAQLKEFVIAFTKRP
ncbi:phosphatidylinositol-3,5-bisphosphate 5-phosphatase [Mortierella sp. NVP41]|nr:phosphatidylinositol-3,5-bisphosphate 5-phosphatase [Mortierella sp. NVP41]